MCESKNKLARILEGLRLMGISGRGVNSRIAEKTGYTLSMVGKILSGKAELGDRFIRMVCTEFGIKEEWVIYGKTPVLVNPVPSDIWNGKPTMIPEGERLKKVRESFGYSLSDMSKQLNIDIDVLQQFENDMFLSDLRLIRKLPLLGINLNWIMTGIGDMRLKVWPIIISKQASDSSWGNHNSTVNYEIDDLFTTRIKKRLGGKPIEKLSNETQIELSKIEKIISGKTIPTVDELEAIAYALGRINPRWLAQKSDFPKEDWEFELFREAAASELPYKIYKLCESAVEDYIKDSQGLIKLSTDKKMQIIGALGRLHIKESSQQSEINKDMLITLISRVRLSRD